MEHNPFSVLIIIKGRQNHLLRVLAGIEQSSVKPAEIIVAHMNEAIYDTDSPLQITHLHIASQEPLPLAKARNATAVAAKTDRLIFLDVDCIPAPDTFKTLLSESREDRIVMVDPYYLPISVEAVDFMAFDKVAQPNPARSNLEFGISERYELFWSLGFCLPKATFQTMGGFDERFTGYGGEDTDFAFSARQAQLAMYYSTAKVYHQHHSSYDPPLNWLADIVYSARLFYEKWGVWPMEGWLRQFAAAGYIDWQTTTIEVIALPTEQAIERARR